MKFILLIILIYLIVGLLLSLIYDYYNTYNRIISQHIKYILFYPLLFFYKII